MPVSTQAKLLRVLEDRRVRRLGASREVDVDTRVLASTNRQLEAEVRAGRFREDLFFRLNVFEVPLPPLRDRLDDIPLLAEAMLRDLNTRHQARVSSIDPEALDLLAKHRWPGNVRELRNAIERAVILAFEGPIRVSHLAGISSAAIPTAPSPDGTSITLAAGVTVDEAERALIEITLRHTGGNRTRAAALLGISQKTLFNKLRDYSATEVSE
jgi:DNA-binding NtrC family response regulator